MEGSRGLRLYRGARRLPLFFLTAGFLLVGVASAHAATLIYSFDPQLSLTGSCSKTGTDGVEDPGCPEKHPPKAFSGPTVATDSHGDIYVASIAEEEGRIDVFNPEGVFITEVTDSAGPQYITVDSEGNLYVFERPLVGEKQVRRFSPTEYEPAAGKISYGAAPVTIVTEATIPLLFASALAVNPLNDQLFVDYSKGVALLGSAKEENKILNKETITGLTKSTSITIDGNHEKIYLSDKLSGDSIVRVFKLAGSHEEVAKFTGSTTPKEKFLTPEGFLSVAVNDATGEFFVADIEATNTVYQFKEDGTYLASINHSFTVSPFSQLAIDDGPFVPKAKAGYLFVPSGSKSEVPGHVYAFKPTIEGPPLVEAASAGEVTETEAVLHALINPEGLPTAYRLEYVSQQQFEEEGGESFLLGHAEVADEDTLPGGAEGIGVSGPALGLSPGTAYRFRVLAENGKGDDEREGTFITFGKAVPPPACSNDALRIGFGALLPDCRAYELVTPPETNGRPPSGVGFSGVYFPTLEASPDGNRASFLIEGGLIPGNEGAGAFNGDLYLATRGSEGWTSEVTGPSGKEAVGPQPGSVSPDQTYSFWEEPLTAVHIRCPDGHSELVGRGSLGEDPRVNAKLITENGSHIIFQTTNFGGHVAQQLEPNAPPAGTAAVYDRSAEGPTHVVSLLPGDVVPAEKEDAAYLGTSEDGEGIVFSIGGAIYIRLDDAETLKVAEPGATFAGVSEGGKRVFYVEGGDLFAYDTEAKTAIAFSESSDVTPVNVATGGTRAYFISPTVLTSEPNPEGEEAEGGKENLYLSEEGQISFIGIVTERDVVGEERPDGNVGGLGLWVESLGFSAPAIDPSRTTPSGATFLFESRADLTGFNSEGFAQVYRYDQTQNRLTCLSCSPTGTPPTSDASLQSVAASQPSLLPASAHAKIPNQSPDGKRAFFQTAEPLVVADTDKLLDVYEWEEDGVGSCEKPGGCTYLISGGHSSSPDFLFAMSASGNDVFFRTTDILLSRDLESTLSLYDARVEGGFPEPVIPPECEGEGCHPYTPPPAIPTKPPSGVNDQVTEPKKRKTCPKGRRKVHRHNKMVCVKRHHKHHRRAGSARKGGAK
jgi:hypothetical protein